MGQIVDDDHRKDREPHDGADRASYAASPLEESVRGGEEQE